MNSMTINNELKLSYPDGFHEMDKEEMQRFFSASLYRQGIYDEDRHILISVAWTKPGPVNYLTDARTILLRAELGMKRGLQDYCRVKETQVEVAGKKARCISFTFTAQGSDIAQSGEMAVFRAGNKFYAVTFVAREDGYDESLNVYHGILESLSLE
ncbi:MAG: hypothetical protein IJH40_05340 [Ruminococcus sp.]|uniref:hypothetical protein n=1 Tax=Ruminococcus sp. TaxID=41978 RepID=UPI0028735B66|nr:hypothetical protein [Ruminococcus sp.]MBQ3285051.1 hypothetical protein [Ruminococcus sp.]